MAITTRATKTEMAICYQFNSVIKKMNHATAMNKGKLTSFYKFEGLLDDGKEIVERLVRDIPEIINEVSAEHHGSANSEVTFAWSKYGAGKKAISRTPKTDICIGEKYTTSLKMGDSQLMSGHTEEATATLHAALDEFPEVYDIPEVETSFNLIQKFERGICFGTCAELIKYGGDPAITRVNNIHKDLMKKHSLGIKNVHTGYLLEIKGDPFYISAFDMECMLKDTDKKSFNYEELLNYRLNLFIPPRKKTSRINLSELPYCESYD